ncbi:hypothetical protein V7125_23535, partial [Neobacillus vireti]
HCTFANRLTLEKLSQAFNYCSEINTICGKIKEVALIDISDKGKAPIIYWKRINRIMWSNYANGEFSLTRKEKFFENFGNYNL